jgi:hypothetical protein
VVPAESVGRNNLMREILVMKSLDHQNIVKLHQVITGAAFFQVELTWKRSQFYKFGYGIAL